jgi:hypothetical protein
MAIDKVTVNMYTCCKCQYKWLGGWDTQNDKERPVPVYCPKCKNVRWNKDYTKEEQELFNNLFVKHIYQVDKDEVDHQEQGDEDEKAMHEFRKVMGVIPSARNDGEADDDKSKSKKKVYCFDIIACDFLYTMKPPADMFELKQVAAIPRLEKRHDAMLSIMEDRLTNHDRIQHERIPKYSWKDISSRYHTKENLLIKSSFLMMSEKVIMEGCKHKDRRKAIAEQRKALYEEQNRIEKEIREEEYKKRNEERDEIRHKLFEEYNKKLPTLRKIAKQKKPMPSEFMDFMRRLMKYKCLRKIQSESGEYVTDGNLLFILKEPEPE